MSGSEPNEDDPGWKQHLRRETEARVKVVMDAGFILNDEMILALAQRILKEARESYGKAPVE